MENNLITIVPFFRCNLNCTFCYNKNVKYIKDVLNLNNIRKTVYEEMDKIDGEIIVKIYGGEIFADFIDDEYYNELKKFLLDIKNYKENVKFAFITNLVHIKTDRWIELLSLLNNVNLSVSFDLVGRFNKETFDIFEKNWNQYEKYIKDIMIIMTKSNILSFLNKDHPEFEQKMIDFLNDKLKNPNVCLNFIDYVSSEDKDDEVVSEDLRYDFYRFLYDNYRKCNVLEQLIMIANGERISGKLCSEKTGIMPDGKYYNICTLSSINNLIGKKDEEYETKKKQLKLLMNVKMGCLKCEYYTSCPSSCPMSIRSIKCSDNCYIKRMIEFIKEDIDENTNINKSNL